MTYDLVILTASGGASVYVKIQCLKFTIGSYGSEHSVCNRYSVTPMWIRSCIKITTTTFKATLMLNEIWKINIVKEYIVKKVLAI